MKIDSTTRISVIIKHNNEAIDAIASINPHFNKLRNPILRKILAPRVSIADAARIGKCSVDELLVKLEKIGFEISSGPILKKENGLTKSNQLTEEAMNSEKKESLDVRPILESGKDPFNAIMEKLSKLQPGYILEVINSFEPTPLIKILEKKGYSTEVKDQGEIIYTYIRQIQTKKIAEGDQKKLFAVSIDEFEQEKSKFKNKLTEIDVRDLEMPLPMVTILNEIETLLPDSALFVHHKKIPQYLLPELADRNFKTWYTEIKEGNIQLLIHR